MKLKSILTAAVLTAGSALFATDVPADLNSASAWKMSSKWKFEGNVLSGDSGNFLFLNNTPQYSNLTFKADIVVNEATSKSWKTTGLGVFKDKENFWRLSFVERPDNDKSHPKQHFLELKMMKQKKWGSYEGIKRVKSSGINWEYGKKYTMVLTMTPKSIDGKILDESGKELAQQTFELLDGAVTGGTPMLTTSGFKVKFSDIKLSDTEK
jgi:hypothetical protein